MPSSVQPPERAAAAGAFVTGTGTEVGKTIVAALIARTASDRGQSVRVFKPAVSGLEDHAGSGVLPDHELLRLAARSPQSDDQIAPYQYGPAVSPHLGAELAGDVIEPGHLLAAVERERAHADFVVCEGVGGFLVPLRLDYLVRDFARDLALPVIVVATPGLGTINHTLLTVESVRDAGLDLAAVVLTPWPAKPSLIERSNLDAINLLGGAPVHTVPWIDAAAPQTWPQLDLGFRRDAL
ncbi:MAG: dethiobiotin synthase [Actinomycetota bacterium]|nr:dethiobiotin synthase [Actinomycetota bacterium]